MAYTLFNTPQEFTPAGNPMIITMGHTDTSASDFKFLADVYIDSTLVARLHKQPTLGQYQFFDLSRVLENYVSYDFNGDLTNLRYRANSSKEYEIQNGYYSGGTEYISTGDTFTGYMFNASIDRNLFSSYNMNDYLMSKSEPLSANTTSPDAGEFLTYYKTRNVDVEDFGTVSTLNWGFNNTYNYVFIGTYSANDSLIGLYRMTNPYFGFENDERICVDIPVYPANLNAAAAAGNVDKGFVTFTAYTGTVIDSSVSYYKVSCGYTSLGVTQAVSEQLTFNLKDNCSRFEHINVAWLNPLGAFDFYNFTMKTNKSNNVSRNEYTKVLGGMDGKDWSYSNQDFERTNYLNVTDYEYLLSTDWLTDDESKRIIEMVESIVVYAKINDEYVGVISTITSISEQTRERNKLNQYTISLKLNYKNKTIRL